MARRWLAWLCLALLLCCCTSAVEEYRPHPPRAMVFARSEAVPGAFVVQLRTRMSAAARTAAVASAAAASSAPQGSWRVEPPTAAAAQTASDVVVVHVSDADAQAVLLRALRTNKQLVRSVFPQRRFFAPAALKELRSAHNSNSSECGGVARRLLVDEQQAATAASMHATDALDADELWALGITGAGIRVAVFDTGLGKRHPHFRNVRERINWTDEDILEDLVGHGTFVAGVIASQTECPGFAPDAELHVFRVFNKDRVSYTSWFLDAFNYAISKNIHVLNLSIGGPDFLDRPFVDKVNEMSANGITVVSAIGNDGPVFGTGNNPADMPDVVGVGGIDSTSHVAPFSSRGMTLWELPEGYGRVKPDIMTYGDRVEGSKLGSGCRSLSGTSVAAPVASGALTLLASAIPRSERQAKLNPAFLKQVLLKGAERIPGASIFEQGYGRLSLLRSYAAMKTMGVHVSVFPDQLDMTDCPYMWPYCSQPLFYGATPIVVNLTVLNSLSVSSLISTPPVWTAGRNGDILEASFDSSKGIWPWSGWLSLHLRITPAGETFTGTAEGTVTFEVAPLLQLPGSWAPQKVSVPVRVSVIPPPPREKRLLWDLFHSIKYPPGFLPRDVISQSPSTEQFDWNGDHPHTNMRGFYAALRKAGFFVDVLGEPYTCFDAKKYGALLIVDPEDEFGLAEQEKLRRDVDEHGLGIVVISDWYDLDVMEKLRFFDHNTKLWWSPATGGSNVPAINDLLRPWGIALGGEAFSGTVSAVNGAFGKFEFLSGNGIAQFPAEGSVLIAKLSSVRAQKKQHVPFFGVLPRSSAGKIAVLGDSSCLDASARVHTSCSALAVRAALFVVGSIDAKAAFPTLIPPPLGTLVGDPRQLPLRPPSGELQRLSNVLGKELPACKQRNWVHDFSGRNDPVVFPGAVYATANGGWTTDDADAAEGNEDDNDNTEDADEYGEILPKFAFAKGGASMVIDGVYIAVYILITSLGIAFFVFVFVARSRNAAVVLRQRQRQHHRSIEDND